MEACGSVRRHLRREEGGKDLGGTAPL
jgi:hypothetical protein